jgi:hypothetical protein
LQPWQHPRGHDPHVPARETFQALRRNVPNDVQANLKLATVYQQLAPRELQRPAELLTEWTKAITCMLADNPRFDDRVEFFSPQAGNAESLRLADLAAVGGVDAALGENATAVSERCPSGSDSVRAGPATDAATIRAPHFAGSRRNANGFDTSNFAEVSPANTFV